MKYLQSPFRDEEMEVLGEGVACRLGTFTMACWSHPRACAEQVSRNVQYWALYTKHLLGPNLNPEPDSEDKLIPLKAKRKQKQTNTPTKNLSSGRIEGNTSQTSNLCVYLELKNKY